VAAKPGVVMTGLCGVVREPYRFGLKALMAIACRMFVVGEIYQHPYGEFK
jgi:hypothetical protein